MIAQSSNNRPSGSSAKSCDAGIPIVGRTSSTGVYEILKVNADGSIATGGSPVSDTIVPYAPTPTATATPGGAIGTGVLLANINAVTTTIDAGNYRINPLIIYDGITGGSINFMLIKQLSAISTYAGTRAPFIDSFSPSMNDLVTGVSGFWHGSTIQQLAGTTQTAYNRSNAQTFYLESGIYDLIVYVDGGITQNAGFQFVGFWEFTKLS